MLASSSSCESASVLMNVIHGATEFKVTAHLEQCMPSPVCCTFGRAIDFQTTGRLNVLPLTCNHLDPSSLQFYDTLLLGYHRPLSSLPSHCNGCGSTFDLSKPLDCCKGRLVTQRHNEVHKGCSGDLVALAYKDVICELIVREASDTAPALIADLGIRCVAPSH